MSLSGLGPEVFDHSQLWQETMALCQELPAVPSKSLIYIGQIGLSSTAWNETRAMATVLNWEDSQGNQLSFTRGMVQGSDDEMRELQRSVEAVMGGPSPYFHYVKDTAPWDSSNPERQAAHARRFAQAAEHVELRTAKPKTKNLSASSNSVNLRKCLEETAELNLRLAELVGVNDIAFYRQILKRAQLWTPQEHRASGLSWL